MSKKLYWKMTKGYESLIVPIDKLDDITYHMEDSDLGDKWTFEVIEMTDEEFEEISEFEGW